MKKHPDQMPSWVKRKGQELARLVLEEETAFMAFESDVPIETVHEEDNTTEIQEDVSV